ncbi:MAG: thioredoxin family protein [Planctomycetota bacterium]|jgi:peroxiredoxin
MDTKLKQIISVLCVLVISGLAAAHCGNCPGDKKACPADCQKACCQKADAEKKACSADCQKTCCKIPTAPDFTLKDLNGKEIQLSKLNGKIVVLEWTNYDCPFVKAHYDTETKTTSKLAKKYAKKDVVWLTINSTHYATAETNRAWAEKHKLKQPVLVDSDGKVGKLFKAKTTPHLFIIDKKGKIAYQGAIDNAPLGKAPEGKEKVNYVDQTLTELLGDKPVTVAKTKPYGCSVKYAKNKDS